MRVADAPRSSPVVSLLWFYKSPDGGDERGRATDQP
jgi:hypothetical protein